MTPYRIEIDRDAQKWLARLTNAKLRERLVAAIDALAQNPRPAGVKKLTGFDHRYRVRVGDCRIIYEVRDRMLLVLVLDVGDRKDIYRRNCPTLPVLPPPSRAAAERTRRRPECDLI